MMDAADDDDKKSASDRPKQAMSKSAFPHWIYDGSPIPDPFGYGQDAVDFIRALKHPASAELKSQFQLYDFQERMTRRIYGRVIPTEAASTRNVFLKLPRGNRKTSIAAAWALLHTIDRKHVRRAKPFLLLRTGNQAGIGFKEAANIVREDRRLAAATRIYDAHNSAKKILSTFNKAELLAVSSDGAAQHGKTPSFVLVDEIHAWKGRDLWEALKSGMAKVPDTLMIIATTAGRGQENSASSFTTTPARLPRVILTTLRSCRSSSRRKPATTARRSCVAQGQSGPRAWLPDLAGLRTMAREAQHRPAERFAFQQYHLNVWQARITKPAVRHGRLGCRPRS